MSKILETTQTKIHEFADGSQTVDTTTVTRKIDRSAEPDYIKLYTKMWCDFNEVPHAQQALFLELATRMSYANMNDKEGGQLVATGGPNATAICENLNIKTSMYQKGLRILCECGAIRRVSKGWYQINPNYAGRGEWKYNPTYNRGGIEDIVAQFRFANKSVDTQIVWADDGTDCTHGIRENVGAGAVIKSTTVNPKNEQLPGQLSISDTDMNIKEEAV